MTQCLSHQPLHNSISPNDPLETSRVPPHTLQRNSFDPLSTSFIKKRALLVLAFDAKSFYFPSSLAPFGIFIIQWTQHVSTFDVTCARFFFLHAASAVRVGEWGKWKYHLLSAVCVVSIARIYMLRVNIHASHHRLLFLFFHPPSFSHPSALNSTFMCSQAKMRQQKWKISFYKMLSHMCVFHLVLLLFRRICKGIWM